jgi:hypothetical protein
MDRPKTSVKAGFGAGDAYDGGKLRMERSRAADQKSFRKSTMLCEAMMISAR